MFDVSILAGELLFLSHSEILALLSVARSPCCSCVSLREDVKHRSIPASVLYSPIYRTSLQNACFPLPLLSAWLLDLFLSHSRPLRVSMSSAAQRNHTPQEGEILNLYHRPAEDPGAGDVLRCHQTPILKSRVSPPDQSAHMKRDPYASEHNVNLVTKLVKRPSSSWEPCPIPNQRAAGAPKTTPRVRVPTGAPLFRPRPATLMPLLSPIDLEPPSGKVKPWTNIQGLAEAQSEFWSTRKNIFHDSTHHLGRERYVNDAHRWQCESPSGSQQTKNLEKRTFNATPKTMDSDLILKSPQTIVPRRQLSYGEMRKLTSSKKLQRSPGSWQLRNQASSMARDDDWDESRLKEESLLASGTSKPDAAILTRGKPILAEDSMNNERAIKEAVMISPLTLQG